MRTIVEFARDIWSLSFPYFRSEERRAASALLASLVLLNLATVYLNILFNEWNNLFYTALQTKDWPVFLHQLFRFCWLAALFIAASVYQLYLNQMLQIRWRRWLTARLVDRWLENRTYYRMQVAGGGADNPDQRIAEDIRAFVASTLTLSLGLLSAAVTLVSFSGVLWRLSGALPIALAGFAFSLPGYMVWAAIAYAVLGTWLANRIGHRLAGLNFEQQRREADFRFALVRVRENAEAIAMERGEVRERLGLLDRFASVVGNWRSIMAQQKRLTWYTSGYGQVAIVFPFVVASPRYFAGTLQLGGLMQTASAFGQVQQALSFVVNAYGDLAAWKAVVDRLVQFRRAMERAGRVPSGGSRIVVERDARDELSLEGLALAALDGAVLMTADAVRIPRGATVLISGPSGIGKSTLLRAIAGVWPFGRGLIRVPEGAKLMFVPQRPYLPVGRLRDVLVYPHAGIAGGDRSLREALAACGLPQLADRLDEARHWSLCLSPGEQERIAFARVFLGHPDWVFLDEATSALDEAMEAALYRELKRRLPRSTVVSIGHRASLAALHGVAICIEKCPGAGSVVAMAGPARRQPGAVMTVQPELDSTELTGGRHLNRLGCRCPD